jgi:son of sevenless-like protein
VHAATLEKLVEQLAVADAIPDWDFIEDFLITFRYFTTGEDLLARLVARYAYELPDSLAAEARETALKWKGPVQIRVINVFKKWLETHFYDFEPVETSPLTRQLNAFADTVAKNNERWASSLRDEALQQRRLRLVERATGQTRLAASIRSRRSPTR